MSKTLIVGGGPGGTGPLIWAAQNGKLRDWLADGVTLVERNGHIGGSLGRYLINSDSAASVYLEFLAAPAARDIFHSLFDDPVTRELAALGSGLPPLTLIDRYFRRVGKILQDLLTSYPNSAFRPFSTVRSVQLTESGSVVAKAQTPDGTIVTTTARTAILALGGQLISDDAPPIPGSELAGIDPAKILTSDRILTADGAVAAAAMLSGSKLPRVVILGGSHSAYSVAWTLMNCLPGIRFQANDIAIIMRRRPRIYYPTLAEATIDAYPVTEREICPRTQRVNRLGGLRGDGREVWRHAMGRSGAAPDHRIQMIDAGDLTASALKSLLDRAALVIPAFGYRAATVPIFDADGRRLALLADHGGTAVDAEGRLLLVDGEPIPNLFGLGLGTGYRPQGDMGGEPGFDGQANSLWLYQNDIGGVIYRGVHTCLRPALTNDAWFPGNIRESGALADGVSP